MSTPAEIQKSPASTPFRHPYQTFVWLRHEWDIARLIADVDSGKLRPTRDTVERTFIEAYAGQVLALDKTRGPDTKTLSFLMSVDVAAAIALPVEALLEPLIFLHAGKNKGMMRIGASETPEHVLGDGQHRIAKAFFEDISTLPSYVLSPAQSRKYLIR